jgi:hypothetical protein
LGGEPTFAEVLVNGGVAPIPAFAEVDCDWQVYPKLLLAVREYGRP